MTESSTIYQYNIDTFTNGFDLNKFSNEIENSAISSTYECSKVSDGIIYIYFSASLGGNVSTLNSLKSAHAGGSLSYPTALIINPYISTHKISSSKNFVCSSFIFDGNIFERMTQIKMMTEHSGSSYDITIYDKTNNVILGTKNGSTNKNKEIITIDNITGTASGSSIIEIQVKGNGTIFIYQINVYLE